jgi:hypothetical protein
MDVRAGNHEDFLLRPPHPARAWTYRPLKTGPKGISQRLFYQAYNGRVKAFLRAHFNNFPVDQLDTRIWRQDTGFSHPLIILSRPPMYLYRFHIAFRASRRT